SQYKYVTGILKKFGFTNVKTASTPMETQKPLVKDEDGKEVDVHLYRSMIGSLMYLASSRPDIMFAVCACARYQVNPKVSHLQQEVVNFLAIDESVEAHLKRIELPKGILDFNKIKLEKAAKQNVPKKSWNKSATAIYDQKSRLYKMIKEVKAFNHSTHKALYDALAVSLSVDEGDMDMILGKSRQTKRRRDDHDKDPSPNADKDSKKRQKKPNSSKNDKDQTRTSKQSKPSSKPSKSNKPVDADEVIQDMETDTEECVEDAIHDSILTTPILSIVRITVKEYNGYGYLKEIVVKRENQKEYVFKEADFASLHLNDIEDMFLLYYQNKLHHLDGNIQTHLVVALCFFIQRTVLKHRVEDVQLGVESYQPKLNLVKP
ncbi:hypothetical protein Tco_1462390, partial [Tanacetum coccineum]